ncbi:MAG TPA: DUF5131 family protein [Pseudolabrys sp.]|uniref:DUF5131 family protein n=1 Tax=Pseudolabrys sp. TaxID=1960880 RepID=UPI002DDD21CC|nr:DUF5131 family protein [Pseudolabrys sp.]HEV2629518.1 DUF5131 family protein [Pseudolabrys sp.]
MLSRVPGWPFPNVWLGVTCESQDMFDRRWPILAAVSSVVRFISYEPALSALHLPEFGPIPDWVICGGETGPNARFMKPKWARNLFRQCADLRVAFFMKQMTNKATIPPDLLVRKYPVL